MNSDVSARIVLRRRTLVLSFILTCAAVAGLWTWMPPLYLTNDDIFIRLGIEGRTAPGEASTGFLLMAHSAFTWGLVALHRVVPDVPIWDLVVAALLCVALAVLFALAWSAAGRDWLSRAINVVMLLVGTIPLLSGIQFTISATLAGGAATAIATVALKGDARKGLVALSALLLLFGLFVRPMGALAGVVAMAMFTLPFGLAESRDRRQQLTALASIVAVAAGAFALLAFLDGVLYRTAAEWDAYYRYNWITGRLFEWGGDLPPDTVATVRQSVGWTTNDWRMLQAAWGVDPNLHNFDRVATAYETRISLVTWREWTDWLIERLTSVDVRALTGLFVDSRAILAGLVIYCAAAMNRRGVVATIAACLLFIAFFVVVAAVFKEVPFRLLAPIQLCLLAAVVCQPHARRPTSAALVGTVALSVVLTVVTQETRALVAQFRADAEHTGQVQRAVAALLDRNPTLIVLHSDAFPAEHWWRPFQQPPAELPAIQLGATAFSQNPVLQRFLTHTARQPLLLTICRDPSIVVVAEPARLDFVTAYLREHFTLAVTWDEVQSGSFPVWRCAPRQQQPAKGSGP